MYLLFNIFCGFYLHEFFIVLCQPSCSESDLYVSISIKQDLYIVLIPAQLIFHSVLVPPYMVVFIDDNWLIIISSHDPILDCLILELIHFFVDRFPTSMCFYWHPTKPSCVFMVLLSSFCARVFYRLTKDLGFLFQVA